MEKKSQNNFFLFAISLAIAVAFLFIFGRVLGRIAFLMLTVFVFFYFVYQIVELLKMRNIENAYENSHASKIDKKISYCQRQIEVNESEIEVINTDIKELNESLDSYHEVTAANKIEVEKLISAFEKERDLRQVKIDFFQACVKKLGTLLHNHKLTAKLFAKKENLQKLKEKNLDDVATFESVKSDIAYEEGYLNTIDELSHRMYKSESLPDAELVKTELELLTKELREFK
ncbi:MAG: Ca2+/Na+ antiporter [Saprospiraceae bacterium]|jgi:Ca2+/Na+ antiporter